METLFTPEALISLTTLTVLEVVLGIDNIIFISILSDKLPSHQEAKARQWGLIISLVLRVGLLFCIGWIMELNDPLLTIGPQTFTGKELILLAGGLFLIGKSVSEIHNKLEGADASLQKDAGETAAFGWIIAQIAVINLIFSFDSILTAIGLVDEVFLMILSVLISSAVMFLFAKGINQFINRHPTFKMLALAFLIMIGFLLAMEAFHYHVDKGYVYVAMVFAVIVEILNIRLRKKSTPVQLRNQTIKDK
jgi:predicted tellurium resistance membrane protein TerC